MVRLLIGTTSVPVYTSGEQEWSRNYSDNSSLILSRNRHAENCYIAPTPAIEKELPHRQFSVCLRTWRLQRNLLHGID